MTFNTSTSPLPQVIFLDAMGTLFDLKNSVGEIYQQFARQYGVEVDAELIERAFIASFKSAPPLAFDQGELAIVKGQEFAWWKSVVQLTFDQLNLLEKFSDFTEFFTKVYLYFESKEPWYIFPDVVPNLQKWQRQEVQLGVISNFDSRLNKVLQLLELQHFFSSTTISSTAGFAKPDRRIFELALKKHNLDAVEAWHIGDSIIEDYQGGKKAGIKSFWLNRNSFLENVENQLPNLSSLG